MTLFQIFINHIPRKIFTYCDSFGSHREPSSDCDHDLVTSRDLDCLTTRLVSSGKQRPVDVAQVVCPWSRFMMCGD